MFEYFTGNLQMKSHSVCSFALLALACFLGSACTGSKLPEGMPSLVPCTITITQDGKPLPDANVSLLPEDEGRKWNASGSTDASGKAVMFTWASHQGVAPGKYKVTVSKVEIEKLPPTSSDSPTPPKSPDSFSLVEDQYKSAETTPLSVEVVKGTKEYTFEAGNAVKNLIPKSVQTH